MPRLLAIGDIHGQADALDALLDRVRPTSDDRLVLLGDYINGGPDSARVLDRVGELIDDGAVALRGNHDEVFEQALLSDHNFETWLGYVGPETPDSYRRLGLDPTRENIVDRHARVLARLRDWHADPEAIFIHARLDPDLPMEDQPRADLLWLKVDGPCRPHRSGRVAVCGHTRQRDGLPRDFDGAICIDTNAKGGAWLTCLDVLKRRCVQARPDGQTRETGLAAP